MELSDSQIGDNDKSHAPHASTHLPPVVNVSFGKDNDHSLSVDEDVEVYIIHSLGITDHASLT